MFDLFLVGGIVRDTLLGVRSKDHDFTVVTTTFDACWSVTDVFDRMVKWLEYQHNVEFFLLTPEHVTARGRFPKDHPTWPRIAADFVLARKDGPSSDGRRPDFVALGTLFDDLARRDFTINAMAQAADGTIIDPHGGQADLQSRTLRFVGEPMDRIREDALRIMRGLRFVVTKDLTFTPETERAIRSAEAAALLKGVSEERRAGELHRMFVHDTLTTIGWLADLPWATAEAIFAGRVRLDSTLRKPRGRIL